MMPPLLEVKKISSVFQTTGIRQVVVENVSFQVNAGEVVGMVGESGCGKSMTALSIMGLLPRRTARVVSGSIFFRQEDLLAKARSEMRKIIGKEITMIFQEPMTSLNPVLTTGRQIEEVLKTHEKMTRSLRKTRTLELLAQVGIDAPEKRAAAYPHQLSGGMRQRVMIAMALACNPSLLIADEPTTALDVTIQAQILEMIKDIQTKRKMGVLMITHDLGVIAEMAETVIVMYAGTIVEQAPVQQIFAAPFHPYTLGLLKAAPKMNSTSGMLHTISGTVPELSDLPDGCRFSNRCDRIRPICFKKEPPLQQADDHRRVRCWNPLKEWSDG